ncbi:MAG: hypothetical protein JNM12_10070 [Alphaproteobacteria bacterium]|nr:hypothetical protein [Alphaproteobacteria bacterium]
MTNTPNQTPAGSTTQTPPAGNPPPGNPPPGNTPPNGNPPPAGQEGKISAYRPEGLADHLYGGSDKETIDKLNTAYQGARSELAKGGSKAPKSAEEYTLNLPDDIKSKVILAGEDGKDPIFEAMKPVLHKNGLSNEGASEIVTSLYKAVADKIAKDQEAAANDPNAADFDYKKLGGKEKAQGLIDASTKWIDGVAAKLNLDETEKQELQLLTTHSQGLSVLNKLRTLTGEKAIPADLSGSGKGDTVTQADIDAVRSKQEYLDGDEGLHAKVREMTARKLKQEGKIG